MKTLKFMVKYWLNLLILVCFLPVPTNAQNQGINNHWIMGYSSVGGLPFGNPRFDFFSGTPVISYDSLEMEFRHTHANISDAQGNLLFYTNGVYIADANHDTMFNGSGINPGAYALNFSDGMQIPQGVLILKKPGINTFYYLFHNTLDDFTFGFSNRLYMSIVDMNNMGGIGSVIIKNFSLITDSLIPGKITACKHANGRDWWIICHQMNSNKFYKLLFTPTGLPQISTQNVGVIRLGGGGQVKFSSDGNYMGYTYELGGFDLFQFDRCTGNLIHILNDSLFNSSGFNSGLEFSPNSQFVYVCNSEDIYQYDVTSPNVLATKTVVAVYDGFQNPTGFGTYLVLPQLAPDGKIYITTGNSTFNFHTIDQPDLPGLSCSVNQHSVQIPAFNFNTIPNHPNYFLGALAGSPCDTLLGVGIDESEEINLAIAPNPVTDYGTLSFPVQNHEGQLEIINALGEIVIQSKIAPWSQFKKIDMENLPSGLYFCRIKWKEKHAVVKLIKWQ
jgi:hypothetical protein